MVALRVVFTNITRGVFCHSCFYLGVWRCLTEDVGDLNTPLLFLPRRGCGCETTARRKDGMYNEETADDDGADAADGVGGYLDGS